MGISEPRFGLNGTLVIILRIEIDVFPPESRYLAAFVDYHPVFVPMITIAQAKSFSAPAKVFQNSVAPCTIAKHAVQPLWRAILVERLCLEKTRRLKEWNIADSLLDA